MKSDNIETSSDNLLGLSFKKLMGRARDAVSSHNIGNLEDIDILVKRDFCQNVTSLRYDTLEDHSSHLVNFLSWFEWGGQDKWDKAAPMTSKWETILELSQLILESKSPHRAYMELKKSKYGEEFVDLLHERKLMKPGEIKEELGIKSHQQVSNILSKFEKAGIIIREVDGKNVWVSLGLQGLAIYRDYLKKYRLKRIGPLMIDALRLYKSNQLDTAHEIVAQAVEEDPQNTFALCLLGTFALERNELKTAGEYFTKAINQGLDEDQSFLFFYILEQRERLKKLNDGIIEMNLQEDKISQQVKPSLKVLGFLSDYRGDRSRAKEYRRLSNVAS